MTVYATKEELRGAIGKVGLEDDDLLDDLLEAASAAIDNLCNRPDGFKSTAAASARVFAGSGTAVQRIDECTSITLVAVKDSPTDSTYTAWAAGDWIAASGDPEAPNFNQTPYTLLLVDPSGSYSHFTSGQFSFRKGFRPDPDVPFRGAPTVQVTAQWGKEANIPPEVRQATIITAARWYQRGKSAWADTVANADVGALMYRKAIDPDVEMLLKQGRLIRPAVG